MWVIILYKRFVIFLCVVLAIPSVAFADAEHISAYNAVVLDSQTNFVLYDKNMNIKSSMASTTKIMTCLIACENGNLEDVVTITNEMLNGTEGSLIYLKAGDKITLLDLIKGAMLSSGNDAANSIAIHIAGSIKAFIKMMNDKAKEIGMTNTNFVTPSGLSAKNHYSTAYDMALLTKYALQNETLADICSKSTDTITINNEEQTIYNHNKLLSLYDECIGVKTGYTEKAGRCLVSAFKYKTSTIIIVTLNAGDDWNDHKKLFDYAKNKYKTITNTYELTLDCVGGMEDKVNCVAKYDVSYLDKLTIKAYYYPIIYTPIIKNTKVGEIKLYSNNILIWTVDIIVLESVKLWQTTK